MSESVPAPTDAQVVAAEEAAAFYAALHEQTPRVYWTPAILAANVAVFAAMALFGHVNVMSPAAGDLLRWGANFAPRTVNGEWWRLFSSMFLHVGLLHLLFNMAVLAQAGPLVERLFGNTAFLILYLVSGLAGGLASLARGSLAVSAGASGAIFGVYGALLGFLILRRHALPERTAKWLGGSAVFFVGFNIVYGITQKGIDLAAHAGGFVAGLLCGLALSWLLTSDGGGTRATLIGLVGACGFGLVLIGVLILKGSVADVPAAIERFSPIESRALDDFNAMTVRYREGEIPGAEAARIVEEDVLRPWRAERERLSSLRHVPAAQRRLVSLILRYMKLREESWELFAEGARREDAGRIRQGNAKNAEAEKVVQEIRKE